MDYTLYICDTETSGLDSRLHDVIEVSFYRLNDGSKKTWRIKPTNLVNIDLGALRVNGHKIEDLKHETKVGRDTYMDPNKAIIEMENWISEDNMPAEQRILVGHNIFFDKDMLQQLWTKCNAKDSFPFGRRLMDTMVWAFMMDYVNNDFSNSYSLSNLIKKYAIKNDKAHTAESDVQATKDLFFAQVAELRYKLGIK
ncbi:DnaQ DNA polymerase III, epsilon subunit and related 3'-5' exonucleases [uncultured Caudovirales phage]|uniref:DnaQ DNA polymerase III, epsilon subunit and related 3'-5' exonucleases n=1 Tax=uncultured Caudovirales phage TaxID=2100421 RepID=A0A6J5RX21_9CAUD|nr:DnaQ DNA polymerase III, epsilon subunit and related 3'-5' exonucleases [uncultured Caudovirales phage]